MAQTRMAAKTTSAPVRGQWENERAESGAASGRGTEGPRCALVLRQNQTKMEARCRF
jgi:hypothetical protein